MAVFGGLEVTALTEFMEIVYPQPGFAAIYGGAVATLLQAGSAVPVMDALMACTAIQYSEPLITRDREHFARIYTCLSIPPFFQLAP